MTHTSCEAGLNPEVLVILTQLRDGVVASSELIAAGFEQVGRSIHILREAGFLIRTKPSARGTLYFLAAEPLGLPAAVSSQGHLGGESDGKVASRPDRGQTRSRRAGRNVPVGFSDTIFDTRDYEVEAA